MLGLRELLELRLLCDLWSFGLRGFRPDWRAKRFKISVKEMTPVSRPEILVPGRAAAEIVGKELEREGDAGVEPAGEERTAWEVNGVAGADDLSDGLAASTTHIRWERVATSLATIWASVEYGLTWNTVMHQSLI